MGAVGLLADVPHHFWQQRIQLSAQSAKPLNFTKGTEAVSHDVFPAPLERHHVLVSVRVLHAPDPILAWREWTRTAG